MFGKGVKMTGYIPRSDTDLLAWATNFTDYASAHLAELGIDGDDIAPVAAATTDFDAKMNDNIAAQQVAESARQEKDASRDALESAIRQVVLKLLISGDIDDRLKRLAPGIFEEVSS